MNELDLVRSVYDDPAPPSASAAASARRRMLTQDDRLKRDREHGRMRDRDNPLPVWRRRRAWRMPLGLIAAATAALMAVGLTLAPDGDLTRLLPGLTLPGGGPLIQTPPGGDPTQPLPGVTTGQDTSSPRGMMLAAATQAERQPQARYWYTHQRTAFAARALGETGGYVVEERAEYFRWTGRSRGDGTSFYGRDFPGKPQTRADADAWRAAGSPSRWRIRSSGLTRAVESKPGPWQEDDPDAHGGGTFNVAGVGQFTYQELQDLPTDPENLRTLLCEGHVKLADGRAGATKRCVDAKSVLLRVFSVLSDTPVPPRVRAGLMRLITDYPGVQSLGAATDPLGRSAVALAAPFESADGRGSIQFQVLFDQRTGELLGSRDVQLTPGPDSEEWQVPGRVLDYWSIVDSGWTDHQPGVPN
ncbi:hypothetical protein GCM10009850_014190 [Nonomuraea monospora]|uniref:CU044_5270 family protein n=1 Tax=Nonomuraea monospora TaxID=568818 RepID=A0ABN3C9D2_9ACTN